MRSRTVSVALGLAYCVIALACGYICLTIILRSFELFFTTLATGAGSRPPAATAAASGGASAAATSGRISVEFEVHGKVQGVFFRKYTKTNADKFGLTGYVKNTAYKTVVGVLEGRPDNVNRMKQWLRTKGSPTSIIEKCNFSNEKWLAVGSRPHKTFEIRKPR